MNPYPPTARQFDLLRFIAVYQAVHDGVSPTLREIGQGLGIGKTNAHRLMAGAAERGLVRHLPKRQRAIELLVRVAVSTAPDGAPLHAVPVRPRRPAAGGRP